MVLEITHPEQTRCFVFYKSQLILVNGHDDLQSIPTFSELQPLNLPFDGIHVVDQKGDELWVSLRLTELVHLPQPYILKDLRMVAMFSEPELFMAAGKARQVLEWDRNHQFCGRCGSPTQTHTHDRAKECTQCGFTAYPRISPCIIVLIHRENEILLARSPRFPPGMYSTLAGFVEIGETLEMTLHREVMEEVGVEVHNLQYFHSQPWPFPHSLMVGFFAEYLAGDITMQDEEIEDAHWWSIDNLPIIPPKGSISRQLIDTHIAKIS